MKVSSKLINGFKTTPHSRKSSISYGQATTSLYRNAEKYRIPTELQRHNLTCFPSLVQLSVATAMNLSSADSEFDEDNASNTKDDGDNDYTTNDRETETVAEGINNIDPQSHPDSYKFKIGTNAEPVDKI